MGATIHGIRSLPANPHDSALCLLLGQNAVHAGMSGRTCMVVGLWNHQFTHIPVRQSLAVRTTISSCASLGLC